MRRWDASLYDLLAAYEQVKLRSEPVVHMVSRRPVITLDAALHHLQRILGVKLDWAELADFLPGDYDGPLRRSAIASRFVAALDMARQGRVELKTESGRATGRERVCQFGESSFVHGTLTTTKN